MLPFPQFLTHIKKHYQVTENIDNTITIKLPSQEISIPITDTDYTFMYNHLIENPNYIYNQCTNNQDLFPCIEINKPIRTMYVHPSDPMFRRRYREKVPYGAKFDPIFPTKNPKSWDPSPDHFKKPDSSDEMFE